MFWILGWGGGRVPSTHSASTLFTSVSIYHLTNSFLEALASDSAAGLQPSSSVPLFFFFSLPCTQESSYAISSPLPLVEANSAWSLTHPPQPFPPPTHLVLHTFTSMFWGFLLIIKWGRVMHDTMTLLHSCHQYLISKITTCHFRNHSLDSLFPIPPYTLFSLALVHEIH